MFDEKTKEVIGSRMYYVSSGDPNGLLPGFVKNMITEAVAKNLERVIVFVAKKNLIKI